VKAEKEAGGPLEFAGPPLPPDYELDELWDEVRADKEPGARDRMRAECIQVAAMAIRFALELTEER
jgi:hypothetical protein